MNSPAIPSNIFDDDGSIVVDVACRRCAYCLRGLNQDGRCPECGLPVARSTLGNLLRFSTPEYVNTLARGVRLMLWGILVIVVIAVLGGCIIHSYGLPKYYENIVCLVAGLLNLYGAWLLTAPDPARIGEDRNVTARRVVRFCLIAGLLGGLVEIAGDVFSLGAGALYILLFLIPQYLLQLTGLLGEFAKLRYIEVLADRIPNPKLARFARYMRWTLCVGLAVALVVGAVIVLVFYSAGLTPTITGLPAGAPVLVPTSNPGGIGGGAPGVVVNQIPPASSPAVPTSSPAAPSGRMVAGLAVSACLAVLATLVYAVLSLVLYIQLAGELRRQAEAARLIWDANNEGDIQPSSQPDL